MTQVKERRLRHSPEAKRRIAADIARIGPQKPRDAARALKATILACVSAQEQEELKMRQLVAFDFSNLRFRGKNLEYSSRSPFDLMVDRAIYARWLWCQSNAYQSLHGPQAVALGSQLAPLSKSGRAKLLETVPPAAATFVIEMVAG